jgi:SAM-dependent methyltransferase
MPRGSLLSPLIQKAYAVRHRTLVFLERTRGLDIRESELIAEVHHDQSRNFRYGFVGNRFLKRIMDSLPITSADAIFDFGCGKGGSLVTFSRYPFRKLGGVELSSKLYSIAQNNMARLHLRHVELFCGDAADFTALDDYTYLYFFNPFSSAVMEQVMRNVLASLDARPRNLTIIYTNPVCHQTILQTGAFVKTAELSGKQRLRCHIYQYRSPSF